MEILGVANLVVGALVIGWLDRYVGENQEGWAWLITAVGAVVLGGIVEWVVRQATPKNRAHGQPV